MKEKELVAAVLGLLEQRGWRAIHQLPAVVGQRGHMLTAYQGPGAKGWPDIFAVRGDRAIAMELKAGRNKPSAEQLAWLADLRAAGIETYIVYDVDWMAGQLDKVLM